MWIAGVSLGLLAVVLSSSGSLSRRRAWAVGDPKGALRHPARLRPVRGWGPRSWRRAESLRRAEVGRLLVAFGAELRAGQPPRSALREAAAGVSSQVCSVALAACELGAGVPAALRRDAIEPGASALRGLAACWAVGEVSGARFAEAVDQLIERARVDTDIRRQLGSELAGPRATARLVGGLPLLGLVFGYALGADPVGWLVGSPIGWAVLALGVLLDLLGLWWMSRLVASVEAQLSC